MNQLEEIALPNPFLFKDGTQVRQTEDWNRRREEIRDLIVGIEYGGLPSIPASVRFERLHSVEEASLGGAKYQTVRVIVDSEPEFSFVLYLLIPPGDGPFPVVLTGDACWKYATDEVAAEVIGRGSILAQFNRVEIATDDYHSDRVSGLYGFCDDTSYGAVAAWAWGYHRCVDVLVEMDVADVSQIAVVGHSRGGKATLLAAATDERIALTCANNSGAGGAGSFHCQGAGSETLADILGMFPYWFGPDLKQYIDRQKDLPFDQHFLTALIAPRPLLLTEATGDLWANPSGTWQTYLATSEVYRFLGAEKQIGIRYREGGHAHSMLDWRAFLDFMDFQFDKPSPWHFGEDPYPDMQKSFSWAAPGN